MFEFEIDGFYFAFPLLMLFLSADKHTAGALALSALGLIEVAGQETLAVFTDEDLATRFLLQCGPKGNAAHIGAFHTPIEFLTLLDVFREARIDWVSFDPEHSKEVTKNRIAVSRLVDLLRSS